MADREVYLISLVAKNGSELNFRVRQGQPVLFHGEAGAHVLRRVYEQGGLLAIRLEPWTEAPPPVSEAQIEEWREETRFSDGR